MCHSSFQCEPSAISKMKSSKSTLSSRVMKQIDFALVVSVEPESWQGFLLLLFQWQNWRQKRYKTEVVNSIDYYKALQMLFLEQRWSQTLCYHRFLLLPLYMQHIRNLQVETHLFIYFTIVINALLQRPSFCVLRDYNRHSIGFSVSRFACPSWISSAKYQQNIFAPWSCHSTAQNSVRFSFCLVESPQSSKRHLKSP